MKTTIARTIICASGSHVTYSGTEAIPEHVFIHILTTKLGYLV